ncbi:MAG: tetratricopeptide repeat protein [Treponema sp.]|jgi:tetratricopeptide (TPR) repeat protein|nr:tetratricopeptide repeat protein [Treponema sp.]
MKLDPVLTRATRLARRGKFYSAVKTLEPEADRYLGSFRYYYLLAVSFLYTGDFGGALTNFKRARELRLRDTGVLLGLAVLYLRRGETDKAVDYYLEVQEQDEKNGTARRALRIIRKYAGSDNLSAWTDSGKLSRLFPPLPGLPLTADRVLVPAAAAAVLALACYGLLVRFAVIPGPDFRGGNRPLSAGSLLDRADREQPVETGGSYAYILTRSQVLDVYERALSLFTEYRDEAAKVNVNRILESNAAPSVKNKARILLSYMEVPGFDTFVRKDNIPYSAAAEDPLLYRDCHVIWNGMATNVEVLPGLTAFDFLVGYDTRKSMEGIVSVVFDRAVSINPQKPLEVLGRIVPGSGDGMAFRLEGVAVHQSGLPAEGVPVP